MVMKNSQFFHHELRGGFQVASLFFFFFFVFLSLGLSVSGETQPHSGPPLLNFVGNAWCILFAQVLILSCGSWEVSLHKATN